MTDTHVGRNAATLCEDEMCLPRQRPFGAMAKTRMWRRLWLMQEALSYGKSQAGSFFTAPGNLCSFVGLMTYRGDRWFSWPTLSKPWGAAFSFGEGMAL